MSWFDRIINRVSDSVRDASAAADRVRRTRALNEQIATQRSAADAAAYRIGQRAVMAHAAGQWRLPPQLLGEYAALSGLEGRRQMLRAQLATLPPPPGPPAQRAQGGVVPPAAR
jgi:hypothetical protein